ncbi:MAG: signal peptidase II [Actinocrinis sp.]
MDTANEPDAEPAAAPGRRPGVEQGICPQDAGSGLEPGARPLGAKRRIGVLLVVAILVYGLDAGSKALVVAKMHYGVPIKLLGPALRLYYTRNSGAAFSIGETYTIIFTAIAVGVVVVILRLSRKLFSLPWAIALGLLLGGAFGNLTDRLARAPGVLRGWVVDFIQIPHWPIFNLADSAICVGGVLMVLLAFRGLHPDGTDERALLAAQAAKARQERTGSDQGADSDGSTAHEAGDDGDGTGSTSGAAS